jgi:hypothetical protein
MPARVCDIKGDLLPQLNSLVLSAVDMTPRRSPDVVLTILGFSRRVSTTLRHSAPQTEDWLFAANC